MYSSVSNNSSDIDFDERKSIVIIIIRNFPFNFDHLCCRLAFYQQNALEPLIFTILFNNFRLNILDLFEKVYTASMRA